jgi:tRNA(adenine34) deaminase
MSFENPHIHFMQEAYKEALHALKLNEVPIGAVVVCAGRIIGRGHNLTERLNDVTAHAEMQALTAASNFLGGKYLDECTLYVTIEPCVMCAGASQWAHLGHLVYGASDEKKGFLKISRSILHPKTALTSGIMEKECGELLTDFFRKKRG